MQVQTSDRLRSLFLQDHSSKPVILLGAGASVKSGIPLSGEIVERAAKWSYCQSKGVHPDDPAIKRSDWLGWLHGHSWYKSEKAPADNYSETIQNLLQPRENRRDFFLRLIDPNVPASPGYGHLLDLMDEGHVETVLTTNFDRVLHNLHVQRRRPHHLETIQTPADYTKFNCSPSYPQLVYVHGSVEHYTDKNLLEEVERLDSNLVSLLFPLLRDHPLIVIGYRGAEPSIMQHLLADQCSKTHDFRRGIFWCLLATSIVHPSVSALATSLGGNMQLVEIRGFDEVMGDLGRTCAALPKNIRSVSLPGAPDGSTIPFDMKVCAGGVLEELDWSRVQVQIVEYCRRMQIHIPDSVTRPWLIERMEQLDLLRRSGSVLCTTMAGYLMFADKPSRQIAGAECHLKLHGEEKRCIDGNLWSQLDSLLELLDELNQPFRLKSAVSESVYPYPPLALKELLVNALVHRDYSRPETLDIDLDSKFIRFTNAGGLVDSVFQVVNTRLQQQIELGHRGIKGYRNPVIADLFYGAGAMDKEGSGLPDVYNDVVRNEGKVFFGPVDETNDKFRALIFRRQEEADAITRTAAPAVSRSKFFANLLEVVGLPEVIWRAKTPCMHVFDILENARPVQPPPFQFKPGSELLTFSDLSLPSNPFRPSIDVTTVEGVRTASLLDSPEGNRNFVELLNRALYRLLQSRGLLVDTDKKRCYFGRTEAGPKEITYQASFRQATRTATKAIVSKQTGKTLYWQHESMYFGFESFQNEWALRVLPGYVFTKDGRYTLLHYSKIGVLATRKAARDFNMQVYNDIVFWTWVLSEGRDSFEVGLADDISLSIRGVLLSCELASAAFDPDLVVEEVKEDSRLARLEEEIAAEAELELEGVQAENNAN